MSSNESEISPRVKHLMYLHDIECKGYNIGNYRHLDDEELHCFYLLTQERILIEEEIKLAEMLVITFLSTADGKYLSIKGIKQILTTYVSLIIHKISPDQIDILIKSVELFCKNSEKSSPLKVKSITKVILSKEKYNNK